MEVQVNLSPEQINKTITEAVAKSAIGEVLEKAIKAEVQKLSVSYNNPIEAVIRSEVHKVIQRVVQEQFSDQIKVWVTEKVTERFTQDLFQRLWEAFERR